MCSLWYSFAFFQNHNCRRADTRIKVPAGKALHEQILHKSLRTPNE